MNVLYSPGWGARRDSSDILARLESTGEMVEYLAVRLRTKVSAGDLQGIVQAQSGLIMQILNGLGQLCGHSQLTQAVH